MMHAWGDLREDALPDAVVVACTNWAAAGLVQDLEQEISVQATIVDSVTVTVWMALKMLEWSGGVDGWGKLLEKV